MRQKITDSQLLRENSIGLSLQRIGELYDCHPTTIGQRLNGLGVAPADTRRGFMSDVLDGFSADQKDWLYSQLGPSHGIKDLVRNLILKAYYAR